METKSVEKELKKIIEKILEEIKELAILREKHQKKERIWYKIYDEIEMDFQLHHGEITVENEEKFYDKVEKEMKRNGINPLIGLDSVSLVEKESGVMEKIASVTGKEVFREIAKDCDNRIAFIKKVANSQKINF